MARSIDPATCGRAQVFTADLPCIVTSDTPETLRLQTLNPIRLSLAPPDFSLTVLPPFFDIPVPKSLLTS